MTNRNWLGRATITGAALVLIAAMAFTACSKKEGGSGGSSDGGSASAVKGLKETPASDFNYKATDDGKGVVITKYSGNGGAVVIPAQIEGLPVVEIDAASFRGEYRGPDVGYDITSVVIPASVKLISFNAFNKCEKLTSVTIMGTGVVLDGFAFGKCINLTEFKFPDNEKALIPFDDEGHIRGTTAFEGCTKLPLAVRGKLKDMGFDEP